MGDRKNGTQEAGSSADESSPAQHGHFHESACLNCGTALTGPYCSACGQEAHLHRTAGAFLHDLAHGVLHWEGRTWRTLPMLAWKPGELTRRYIEGERKRFVSPMALFLFSIFLIFATFQIMGSGVSSTITPQFSLSEQARTLAETLEDELADQRKSLAKLPADDPERAVAEQRITGLEEQLQHAGALAGNLEATSPIDLDHPDTGLPMLDKGITKWRKNPGLMLYKMQANSYKFSWLIIPLSLPFVWLLFAWKRRFGLYDHAVFVTYSLSFMSLLFLAISVAGRLGASSDILVGLGSAVALWHIHRQLRGAYALSRFSAVWRTIALIFFIAIIIVLFAGALLMLGVMG